MNRLNVMSIVDQQAKEYIAGIGYDYPMDKEDLLLSYRDGNINIKALKNPDNNINYRLNLVIPYIHNYISSYKPQNFNIILSLGDTIKNQYKIPSIAFTKKKNIKCFLIPNIDLFTGALYQSLKEVDQNDIDFESKEDTAIFIGSSTGPFLNNTRLKLCQLSQKTNNIKAYIHNLCQSDKLEWIREYPDIESYIHSHISITDQLKHKITINIDGNTMCWSRLYWQMRSNSIPLYINKTQEDIQFFDYLDNSQAYLSCSLEESIDLINSALHYPLEHIDDINNAGKNYIEKCFNEYIENPTHYLQNIINIILNNIKQDENN